MSVEYIMPYTGDELADHVIAWIMGMTKTHYVMCPSYGRRGLGMLPSQLAAICKELRDDGGASPLDERIAYVADEVGVPVNVWKSIEAGRGFPYPDLLLNALKETYTRNTGL